MKKFTTDIDDNKQTFTIEDVKRWFGGAVRSRVCENWIEDMKKIRLGQTATIDDSVAWPKSPKAAEFTRVK